MTNNDGFIDIEYNTSLDGEPEFLLGQDNIDIECADNWELELIATNIADHYWSYYGGYESGWPMKFEIFAGGVSLGIFEVDMEMSPNFTSRRVDK